VFSDTTIKLLDQPAGVADEFGLDVGFFAFCLRRVLQSQIWWTPVSRTLHCSSVGVGDDKVAGRGRRDNETWKCSSKETLERRAREGAAGWQAGGFLWLQTMRTCDQSYPFKLDILCCPRGGWTATFLRQALGLFPAACCACTTPYSLPTLPKGCSRQWRASQIIHALCLTLWLRGRPIKNSGAHS